MQKSGSNITLTLSVGYQNVKNEGMMLFIKIRKPVQTL